MKLNKIGAGLLALSILFLSCSRSDNFQPGETGEGGRTTTTKPQPANDFVWKGLNLWYYWKDQVPALADNAFKNNTEYANFVNQVSPTDLFYGLLYRYNVVDRFSWIVDDVDELMASFNGIQTDTGMDYSLARLGDTGVFGMVNYVVPGSPAEQAGIKRGDCFFEINGQDMNINNYSQLQSGQFSLGIGINTKIEGSSIYMDGIKTVNLTAVSLEENPVAYYKNFKIEGKNIGYLVYNGFQSLQNKELNAAFGKMKQDGVKDLILDLRYNGGGSVETATALGQMITGQFTGQPYVYLDFNKQLKDLNEVDNLSNQVTLYNFVNGKNEEIGKETINSLGLNKVYILTSNGTASASELTIDGLRAYIDVETIGDITYGKFVGSITLFDSPKDYYTKYENKISNWGMQPIVFSYYNGKRDPHPEVSAENKSGGIAPKIFFDLGDYIGVLGEFGDETKDVALAAALDEITGKKQTNNVLSMKRKRTRPDVKALGTSKTLKPFGTEVYLENFRPDTGKLPTLN